PKAERALPRLLAELATDLGEDAVGRLSLGDAWSPEDRSRFVRIDTQAKLLPERRPARMLSSVPEPTRLLPVPVPVSRESLTIVPHLARLEGVEWWRAPRPAVDDVYAFLEEGAPAFVEIERGSSVARIRGLFD